MKAVVAALVLIVGAAVVLWYGNTLNSWVLGGLIGGLAALLLSIPISLTIFSFLSRHHDQRLRANEEEYEPAYEYPEVPERIARSTYVVEEDRPRRAVWSEEEEWYEEEEDEEDFYDRTQGARRLPPTQAQPRLPAPAQQRPVQRLPAPQQRGAPNPRPAIPRQLPERSALTTRQLPQREKDITGRRPTQQRMSYPGHPGYQAEGQQSQIRSQALRTARLEAARQREEDEIEELPSYRPKRSSVVRPNRALSEQQDDEQEMSPRTQPGARQYPRRPRQIVDSSPTRNDDPYSASYTGDGRQRLQQQQTEPETDTLNPSKTNGNLKSSLVRRAPYMYEDDPLRKQLSQQVDGPITRRSSRNLAAQQEEE